MTNLKRFWQAVESLPSLAAVESEWLSLLHGDYNLIKPFMRPCAGLRVLLSSSGRRFAVSSNRA